VSEVDIDTVTVGQPVTLTFDALADKQYTGAITDIGAIGTVSGGVANFTVTLVMKDADQSVRPGMMATANVIVSQVNDVLLVPNHSITTTGQRKIIYVLANSQVTPVVVTVGMASDTQTEITSTNLKSGDVVVTNPTSVTTSTTTTTGVNSVFANLFRALGVTTTGGAAGQGGRVPGAGGFPQGGFDGTRGGPPSGNPPSGGD
jgi:multidrug efflux pump subunit AcrA (membrane-fusion protein)